jgi:hypothetical protein
VPYAIKTSATRLAATLKAHLKPRNGTVVQRYSIAQQHMHLGADQTEQSPKGTAPANNTRHTHYKAILMMAWMVQRVE